MPYEVELKFRVDDALALRSLIETHGARPAGSRRQIDTYLAHPMRSFAETDEALRIRLDGTENCLTYKGPKIDPATKTRREIEIGFDSGGHARQQMLELFLALGFQRVGEVAKTRFTYDLHWQGIEVEVAIDEVDGLGTFAELEASADEDQLDAVRTSLWVLATTLGLHESVRRSYLEMLLDSAAP